MEKLTIEEANRKYNIEIDESMLGNFEDTYYDRISIRHSPVNRKWYIVSYMSKNTEDLRVGCTTIILV